MHTGPLSEFQISGAPNRGKVLLYVLLIFKGGMFPQALMMPPLF